MATDLGHPRDAPAQVFGSPGVSTTIRMSEYLKHQPLGDEAPPDLSALMTM